MVYSSETILGWVEKLTAIAVILQTIELGQIRKALTPEGIWSWDIVRRDFDFVPFPVRKLLDFFLRYPGFLGVLLIRLIAAILIFVFPQPGWMILLFSSTVLVSLRWRGTFNGGSDSMTLLLLAALCVATAFPDHPKIMAGCLGYIAIQTCLSYFISGIAKLRQAEWRTGRALGGFLDASHYSVPAGMRLISDRPWLLFFTAWGVMVFECSFPLVFLNAKVCVVYLGLSLLFQGANFYIFGLNRFLFAWAAAYPALFYCSQVSL